MRQPGGGLPAARGEGASLLAGPGKLLAAVGPPPGLAL
jgi:hypothetical protein